MKKVNKQAIVEFIIGCLKAGEARASIIANIKAKGWDISLTAIDRFLRKAKEQYAVEQERLRKELEEVDRLAAIEARKRDIMSAEDRKELLSKIARGEVEIPTKEPRWSKAENKFVMINIIELANHTARISAIAELNRMDGAYAPAKIAPTDTDGKTLPPAKRQVFVIGGTEIEF